MKYLLDSHILIWALFSDEKLAREAFNIINSQSNEIYYSAASIWEIGLKHAKAPDKMPVSGKMLPESLITHDQLLDGYDENCIMTV